MTEHTPTLTFSFYLCIFQVCWSVRPKYYLPRWWLCHSRSVSASAMWWKRCSSNHPRLCTTPAGSSESESQRPRQDKVSGWLGKYHWHLNPSAFTCACHVWLCVSASDYGLFLSDDDPRKGIWLESVRTLDYYMLRNGVRLSHRVWGEELSLIIS